MQGQPEGEIFKAGREALPYFRGRLGRKQNGAGKLF
jgi:hypothetical protein